MMHTQATNSLYRQKGAISIMTTFILLVLLMFLVLVLDSGRLYMEQRKLQKVADTAALGALMPLPDGNCSTDRALTEMGARDNTEANGFIPTGKRSLTLQCADINESDGLRVATPNNASGQAVEVTVSHAVPSSLILQVGSVFNSSVPEEVTLQATAVAVRDEPVAVFSVGSQLLRLNDSKLLGTLLTAVGLKPETLTLLDSVGLANVTIKPSGLLAALGVKVNIDQLKALSPEGVVDLVNTQVGLLGINRLIDASIQLIDDSFLLADLEALRLQLLPEAPLLQDLNLNLFATPDSPGILSLNTNSSDPTGAALEAGVNLGDILITSILIGAQGRALSIGAPDTSGAPTDALNLLRTVQLQAGIVEPPSIGIGPVGTTAYNAQVRLKVDVNTSEGILGPLLDLLGTSIHLPIIIDLTNAKGEVAALSCDGPDASATIEVVSALGSTCIGKMAPGTMWSTRGSCVDNIEDQALIRLLSLNLLYGSVKLPVLATRPEDLIFRQENLPETQSSGTNPLHVGTLVADLIDEVLDLLGNSPAMPEKLPEEQAIRIADHYLNSVTPAGAGSYTFNEISQIGSALRSDGIDWDRPIFLFSQRMTREWANSVRGGGCLIIGSAAPLRYEANCARDKLIDSLQSDADTGLLDKLLHGLVGKVLQPLLATIINALLAVLEPLLNAIGEFILAPLLEDVLGLELNRTDVTVQSIGCGAPRLVR